MVRRILLLLLLFMVAALVVLWLITGGISAIAQTAKNFVNPINIFSGGDATGSFVDRRRKRRKRSDTGGVRDRIRAAQRARCGAPNIWRAVAVRGEHRDQRQCGARRSRSARVRRTPRIGRHSAHYHRMVSPERGLGTSHFYPARRVSLHPGRTESVGAGIHAPGRNGNRRLRSFSARSILQRKRVQRISQRIAIVYAGAFERVPRSVRSTDRDAR